MGVEIAPSQIVTATVTETINISDLDPASALAAANEIAVSQGGTDFRATLAALQTFLSPVQAFVTSGIDALATGQTTIVPAQTGKRFYPVGNPLVELTAKTGAGTVCTLSIGNDATNYINIVAATALTGLTTVNNLAALALLTPITSLASININTNPIKVNVSVAATLFSVYTVRVILFGFVL